MPPEFSVERVRQMFGVSFFEGRDKILLLDEALKLGLLFQNWVLKLFKICKFLEKQIFRQMQNFHEKFRLFARCG